MNFEEFVKVQSAPKLQRYENFKKRNKFSKQKKTQI